MANLSTFSVVLALYFALYLVKVRHIVPAAVFFCSRIGVHGNHSQYPINYFFFVLVAMVLGFVGLLFLLFVEGMRFFTPYDKGDLDIIARDLVNTSGD
jgi:hypothetical protein